MTIGDLFLKSTLYVTRVKDSKKMSSNKNTKFNLTCPLSKFAKNLWKHILPCKFSSPKIKLIWLTKVFEIYLDFPILRSSTFRCLTKRVLHEIEQNSTPPRITSSTLYEVTNKSATLRDMHIRSFSTSTQRLKKFFCVAVEGSASSHIEQRFFLCRARRKFLAYSMQFDKCGIVYATSTYRKRKILRIY
uniref:Uncharacterized protein n=1 Tax=Acrobeloides nanus TaxID=290746 RepID=A0A914CGF6_9BILA